MLTLCLTGITLPLPKSLTAIYLPNANSSPQSLKDSYLLLSQQQQTPSYIAFSATTPTLLMLASQQCWPDALYLLQENKRWLELPSGEYWTADSTPVEATETPTEATANTQPQKPPIIASQNIQPKKDGELLDKVFKTASWGEHEPENRAQLDNLFAELLQRSQRNPQLIEQAQQRRNLGNQAYKIGLECESRLQKNGYTPEFAAWFQKQTNTKDAVSYYLIQKLKKWQTWREKKRQQMAAQTVCQLAALKFDDHHPNSLRHLPIHHHWQILIDETGSEFDNSANLSINNKMLGRMVALAIPVNKISLPPINEKFHATNESDATLDQVIGTLLNTQVGIVGITVNDELLGKSSRWFSGIYMLMRLVLRLLPVSGQAKVEFFIEQRSSFNDAISLLPVQQLLEAELHGLDKERFKNIQIKLQFTNKAHHPANGYVDALAHMWAGGSANSKQRIKHSALKGHCLLEPHHDVIERSYAAVDNQHTLSAKDWYALVSAISQEPSTSLLHSVLQQLGTHIQQQVPIWNGYLAYVNQLLQHKNYHLLQLKTALDWLANYTPKECVLPSMLRLHWYMARLACANHLGQHDMPLLSQALSLGQSLLNENAAEVCHLHLRIAVAATNQFEFESAQHILDFWQAQDPRLMGLNNYGKYLSSLGQLAAFRGEQPQAIGHFEQALATFSQLSDRKESTKQQRQTQIYRLIALTDNREVSDNTLQHALEAFWQQPLAIAATTLAKSDNNVAFEQHLLLRAMISRPALQQASYLENAPDWQFEETHPWPLIAAYRAILLQPQQPVKASLWMHKAIEACRESQGATLQWMGEVLATMAQKLAIIAPPVNQQRQQSLQQSLTHVPWSSFAHLQQLSAHSSQRDILAAFAACLPFNFH